MIPGEKELAKIEDLALRVIGVDNGTNLKLQGAPEESLAEQTMAMKFRHESPKMVLMLIDKLRSANKLIVHLTTS